MEQLLNEAEALIDAGQYNEAVELLCRQGVPYCGAAAPSGITPRVCTVGSAPQADGRTTAIRAAIWVALFASTLE